MLEKFKTRNNCSERSRQAEKGVQHRSGGDREKERAKVRFRSLEVKATNERRKERIRSIYKYNFCWVLLS